MQTGFDYQKARKFMEEADLRCLMATSHDNVFYTSGADLMSIDMLKRLTVIILPREGDAVFAVHANEAALSRKGTWITDLRVYQGGEWEPLKPVGFVANILKQKALEHARVGIEMQEIPALYLEHLRTLLPAVEFVDAKPLFDRLRAVKTDAELRLLSTANMATAKAIAVAFEMARPGDSEREIAQNVIRLAYAYGADQVGFITLSAGENIFETHHVPSEYSIKPGDLVHVDFGCFFAGYMSDISRTAVVGPPDERQQRIYQVAVGAERATAQAMRAGAKIIEVHQAAKNFYESQGFSYDRAFIGHGLGIGCHEFPFLGATHGDWVLEPGMLFQVEPRVSLDEVTVHTEDSFIIVEGDQAKNVSEYRDVADMQVIR
jgi:Xaa-Pro aminopeptidase